MPKANRTYKAPPVMRLVNFEAALRSQGRTDSTTKAYLRWCDEFGMWLSGTEGPEATPSEALAREFLSYCQIHRKLSPATLNNVRQALASWSRVFEPPGWFYPEESAPTALPPDLQQFSHWLRDKAKADRTVSAYIQRVRLFQAWYEEQFSTPFDPRAWVASDVTQYRKFLSDRGNNGRPTKPSTVNLAISALSMYGTWAEQAGLITRSPVQEPGNLMVPGETGTPKWLPTKEDGRLHRELVRRTQIPYAQPGMLRLAVRDLALCLMMRDAGLRAGEVCSLRLQDVDLTGQVITVWYGKWGRTRHVPMTKRLAQAVKAWLSVRGPISSEFLFLSERNLQLTPHGIQHRAAKWRKWADLPEWFTPHSLRHTFAHALVQDDVDLIRVATLLGHMRQDGKPNLDMVAVYNQPSQAELREAIDRSGL